MIRVTFAFEDTPESREHLSHLFDDESWLRRPDLTIGVGLLEREALFILTKAISEHGAIRLASPTVDGKVGLKKSHG